TGAAPAGIAISVNGALTTGAGGGITLLGSTAAKGGIALAGTVDASTTGKIDLSAGADGVVQSAGSLVADSLLSSGGIGRAAVLAQTTNGIAEGGDIAAVGGFAVATANAVTIGGKLPAATFAITSSAANAAAMNASGALTANNAAPAI